MRLAHGNSQRVGLAERAEARKVMPSGEIAFAGDGHRHNQTRGPAPYAAVRPPLVRSEIASHSGW